MKSIKKSAMGGTFVIVVLVLFIFTSTVLALDWSPIQRMGWGGDWDTSPNMAADQNGNLYVVWTTYPFSRYLYFNNFDGTTWGSPQRISGESENNFDANIAVDSSGHVHVVWQGTGYRAHYRYFDGTSWAPLSSTSLTGGGFTIAVTNSGEIIIASG